MSRSCQEIVRLLQENCLQNGEELLDGVALDAQSKIGFLLLVT